MDSRRSPGRVRAGGRVRPSPAGNSRLAAFAAGSLILAVALATPGVFTVGSAAAAGGRVFYLGAHPRQCLIAPTDPSAKLFTDVPCANSAHNLEVYAVVRGGWGKAATLRSEGLIARSRCLARYRRLVGHGAPSTAGWEFLFADPGAEAARYGDRIVCAFRTWPRLAPLGSGWHVR